MQVIFHHGEHGVHDDNDKGYCGFKLNRQLSIDKSKNHDFHCVRRVRCGYRFFEFLHDF